MTPAGRVIIRLLSYLVIASAAVVVWTRGALVYVFGARQVTVFLWIAAGGTVCAVVTLVRTRKRSVSTLQGKRGCVTSRDADAAWSAALPSCRRGL
jgi:hypothetical protein